MSEEQQEYRALLQKDWARYQRLQHIELHRTCMQIQRSQQTALAELRKESEELYQAAIQPDEILLPITLKGPVDTPPIKNYETPAEYRLPFEIYILLMTALLMTPLTTTKTWPKLILIFSHFFTGWRL